MDFEQSAVAEGTTTTATNGVAETTGDATQDVIGVDHKEHAGVLAENARLQAELEKANNIKNAAFKDRDHWKSQVRRATTRTGQAPQSTEVEVSPDIQALKETVAGLANVVGEMRGETSWSRALETSGVSLNETQTKHAQAAFKAAGAEAGAGWLKQYIQDLGIGQAAEAAQTQETTVEFPNQPSPSVDAETNLPLDPRLIPKPIWASMGKEKRQAAMAKWRATGEGRTLAPNQFSKPTT